jgi:hypothetical protein
MRRSKGVRQLIFKFAGGPLDGKRVAGELAKHPEIRRYYALTHHGRMGQRFRTASEYAIDLLAKEGMREQSPHHFQQYLYQVTENIDNGNVVLVRVEYVPKD